MEEGPRYKGRPPASHARSILMRPGRYPYDAGSYPCSQVGTTPPVLALPPQIADLQVRKVCLVAQLQSMLVAQMQKADEEV
mmetsp:Transcript_136525/g.236936  ORF Transcript_136525/g.236936 Transcript_136525/m.236936 type:complete len:81 (-) Transcript_136525:1609-1851(-)